MLEKTAVLATLAQPLYFLFFSEYNEKSYHTKKYFEKDMKVYHS
jgi:hypothetical protein